MVSIKKLLSLDRDDLTSSLLRVVLLLLETIAVHALDYNQNELESFRARVRKIGQNVEHANSPADLLNLTSEAILAIELYNRGAERFIGEQRCELQSVIRLLTATLLEISKSSEESAANLHKIEHQLEQACQIDDLRVLKSTMAESLKAISQEASNQRAQAAALSAHLERALKQTTELERSRAPRVEVDPLTGLPSAAMAEEAFAQDPRPGKTKYVVAMKVERLEMINGRFGFAAGDEILMLFSQHLAQKMSGTDQLFRWRGPCFVILLERSGSLEMVRGEITKFTATRFEHTIEIGDREIMVSVSASCMLFPITLTTKISEFSRQIDALSTDFARRTS